MRLAYRFLGFTLLLSFLLSASLSADALRLFGSKKQQETVELSLEPPFHLVGADYKDANVKALVGIVEDLLDASNAHDMQRVSQYYSPRFISGDNLDLKAVKALVKDTWELYPDIHYKSEIVEIRVNGDWATVETKDSATASAKESPSLEGVKGKLSSQSRGQMFLHRVGKQWLIESDQTLYEQARVLYGDTQGLDFSLVAPDQVFSGEGYSAGLDVDLPRNYFAIATISRESLVFPQPVPEERFRTLSEQKSHLLRVFQANEANHNEIVSATVGLTQVGRDIHQRPVVSLKGIATLVKRVNVLPKSTYDTEVEKAELVRSSANGKIKLEAPEKGQSALDSLSKSESKTKDAPKKD